MRLALNSLEEQVRPDDGGAHLLHEGIRIMKSESQVQRDAVIEAPSLAMPGQLNWRGNKLNSVNNRLSATVAFTGVVMLGMAALAGLLLFRGGERVPTWFGSLMLAASLMVSGLMAWTANVGGQIRHTEIRSNASPPTSTGEQAMDR